MMPESISSELIMSGGGVRSILLLPLVGHVCIWRMFVFMSVVVTVFFNAARGCKRRPYGRDILQSRSHNCFVGSHECLLLFMICKGLCACTEMLWMCVLYVSFGSKVRSRTFGCVAMGSAF